MEIHDTGNPLDRIDRTRQVLDFLIQTTCWSDPADHAELPPDALCGLAQILSVCRDALEKAQADLSRR
ncbi:MAG: hypothetical protein LBQ51_04750 [Desulfovibrio sp.]|jgi:hypothetical protein|nr:hypothetical protein [Desulfovibrio sp.]